MMVQSATTTKKFLVWSKIEVEIYRLISNLQIQNLHTHRETSHLTLLNKMTLPRKIWPALFTHSFLPLVHSITLSPIFSDDNMILTKRNKEKQYFSTF